MFKKLLKFLFFFVLPISFITVLVICFFTFKKLVLPTDIVLKDGRKKSEIAAKIRSKLLKRNDIQNVSFKSKDGLKLVGYLVKRKNAIANILLCHGYQSCKEFVSDVIDMFPDYNVLLFDFRAHGKSEGRFRTIGCHEHKDVIAAAEYLKEQTKPLDQFAKPLPLVIAGFSMGGAMAIEASVLHNDICDAIIVDSSYADLNSVISYAFTAKSGLPKYPFLPILRQMLYFVVKCDTSKVKPIEWVKNINKPILFIHSCVDNIVSPIDSLNMYANCSSKDKKLWIAPICKHGLLHRCYPEIYQKKIRQFLKRTIQC